MVGFDILHAYVHMSDPQTSDTTLAGLMKTKAGIESVASILPRIIADVDAMHLR